MTTTTGYERVTFRDGDRRRTVILRMNLHYAELEEVWN